MKKRIVYHVTYDISSNEWKVKRQGTKRAPSKHSNKDQAITAAIYKAMNNTPSQVKIHKRDGKIQEERTYGGDPERYPG
jgi:hypothetical protein